MKNLKKVLSVILTVAMLISSIAAVSAVEYGDVDATNSYYKAINVLSGLGVVKGDEVGNFNPTNDIKRSEMVTLVCRALGDEDVALSAGGATFDDVSADHWAAGYIAWGVASGIVNGVGDNKFDPDAPVKFQDAVVMVMRALGYDKMANRAENGGYPTGYLKLASQKGVLAGASYAGAKEATREVVAQVIYNALTAPIVTVNYAANPEDDEYIVNDGKNGTDLKTLLTYTNEIYKVKASVEATGKEDKKLRDDNGLQVKLLLKSAYDQKWADVLDGEYDANDESKDDLVAYVGATDVADYYGYTVEAYIAYNEDLDDWEVLAVVADAKATVSLTITEGFEAYKAGTFEYYENANDAKVTELDLAKGEDLTIYYNAKEIKLADIEAMTSKAGDKAIEALLVDEANILTFVGTKSEFNKIFVTDFQYAQVDDVNVAKERISMKDGKGTLKLGEDDRGEEFVYNLYDADGNVIGLDEIKEDDILNIVAPYGKLAEVDYMDIYVTDATVTGSVTEEYADGSFAIDGEAYDVIAGVSIKAGYEGTFYLTIDGLIFKADASAVASKNYAFIVDHGKKDSGYTTSKVTHKLVLFTADGEATSYDVASTLRVYNKYDSKYEYKTFNRGDEQDNYFKDLVELFKADTENKAKENLPKRVATFRLNDANEIVELRFAAEGAEFAYKPVEKAKYNDDLLTFGGEDLDDNSVLFVAPVTKEGTKYVVNEDDLAIAAFSSIDKDETIEANIFMYADDETIGAAIVAKELESALSEHLAILKSTSKGVDTTGAEVAKYTFIYGGEVLTATVEYGATKVDDLTIGDVFLYAVNADGEIYKTEVVVDVDDKGAPTYTDYNKFDPAADVKDFAIVYGEVKDVNGDKLTIDGAPVARMNETAGNTYAQFDLTKFGSKRPSDAVTALDGYAEISKSDDPDVYYVVAIINEDNRYEDIIQFYSVDKK